MNLARIFKILQAMRPYIKSGEMNLENALKYFSEKGIEMTGVARKAVENAFKKVKGSKDEVFDDTVEKLPYDDQGIPFNPRKPQKEYGTSVKSMMDDEQYFNFKEGYFGKIIANDDKAVQGLATRVMKGEQDIQFNRLSPDQKKDFLNMVQDRLTLGNKEFMMTYTDDAGAFANPTNINRTKQAAGGRVSNADGGIIGNLHLNRTGYKIGSLVKGYQAGQGAFTKAQVLIKRLENTIKEYKGKTDELAKYVQETFPNFIKEIKANPKLADNENVWKELGQDLPSNQELVVYGDDTVDFFRQTEGPGNIERVTKFLEKNPFLNREEAIKIMKMKPTDQVMEVERLKTIRTKKHALGGRVQMADGGLIDVLKL